MYQFKAYGHPNVTGSHTTTLEITKEKEIGQQAHCIIAVGADYSLEKIKALILRSERIQMTIESAGLAEALIFIPNNDFSDNKEIVIRKSTFISSRTLGVDCDKASSDLSQALVEKLKKPEYRIKITLKDIST